jgi:hypothetical protein
MSRAEPLGWNQSSYRTYEWVAFHLACAVENEEAGIEGVWEAVVIGRRSLTSLVLDH